MAETTNIAWTRSSLNPWIGCTKVGPGCDGCYAEVSYTAKMMGVKWGPGQPRYRTRTANWNNLVKWNQKAKNEREAGILWQGRPGYWPVFIASLSDVFDNEVPHAWRQELFAILEDCTYLSPLIVTKRVGNVAGMVPSRWMRDGFPPHIRILSSIVNNDEAERDLPKLLALPCHNGVSYEPALCGVHWLQWVALRPEIFGRRLEWLIVGGESSQPGHPARPFDVLWAYSAIEECRQYGVPVFIKQLGDNPYFGIGKIDQAKTKASRDPAEWAPELRVQEFPA